MDSYPLNNSVQNVVCNREGTSTSGNSTKKSNNAGFPSEEQFQLVSVKEEPEVYIDYDLPFPVDDGTPVKLEDNASISAGLMASLNTNRNVTLTNSDNNFDASTSV
jgi:hypothetical protein